MELEIWIVDTKLSKETARLKITCPDPEMEIGFAAEFLRNREFDRCVIEKGLAFSGHKMKHGLENITEKRIDLVDYSNIEPILHLIGEPSARFLLARTAVGIHPTTLCDNAQLTHTKSCKRFFIDQGIVLQGELNITF